MQRPLALVAAWVVAAAAAVGVGFLAVSLIDASAATPTPAALTGEPTRTQDTAPPAAATSAEQATAGGTVFAACADGGVQLAAAPEAGWTIEQYADHVEFRSATEKIEVYADCGTGSPRFTVEGPRADDSSAGVPPAPTTATTTASTSEDGGGHGSDDPPGDDHGGSGGGGHGSDD